MYKKHRGNRNRNRTIAIIIVALVSLSMIGSSFALFFTPDSQTVAGNGSEAGAQIQALQSQVDGLNESLKSKPEDANLHLGLANAYYDLGMTQLNTAEGDQAAANAEAGKTSLKQAITEYQEVLKTKKDDVSILVDMATAAFYSDDTDLAEATFQQALAIKPDFLNGLQNYGVFLIQAKGDYLGAIAQFNKALNANPSQADVQNLNELIEFAQSKLNESIQK